MKTKVWTKEGRGGTNDRANVISDMTERGTIGERKEQKILKGGGGGRTMFSVEWWGDIREQRKLIETETDEQTGTFKGEKENQGHHPYDVIVSRSGYRKTRWLWGGGGWGRVGCSTILGRRLMSPCRMMENKKFKNRVPYSSGGTADIIFLSCDMPFQKCSNFLTTE